MDALPNFELVHPKSLDDVVKARAAHPASQLLGCGTDLVVNIRRGILAPPVLVELNTVAELRAVKADAQAIEIGAAVTLAELAAHPEVMRHYPVVAQAAAFIAGPTHRNMGTVGGNLCLDTRCLFYNQSEWWRSANNHCLKTTGDICHVAPKSRGVCFATFSGDLAPALLTLGAEVDLAGLLLVVGLLLAVDRQRVLLRLDREISVGEAGDCNRDAIVVLAGARYCRAGSSAPALPRRRPGREWRTPGRSQWLNDRREQNQMNA